MKRSQPASALRGEALAAARQARARAYAPYSKYRVGAAIVTRSGGVYAGCNVENATFGATLCAERSAIAAMVAGGDRDPVLCVVLTEARGTAPPSPHARAKRGSGPTRGLQPAAPCGICRQVLVEFARDMALWLVAEDSAGRLVRRSSARLSALLPQAFRLADVGANANVVGIPPDE